MGKKSILKNYGLLAAMLLAIVLGCVLGAMNPLVTDAEGAVVSAGATILKPLGTVFINLMFCIVVPMVFASISSAVANMKSRKRAGKIMGTTILTFVVTGAIAALLMIVLMKLIPPVLEPWANIAAGTVDEQKSLADLIVSFFTVEDFSALLSRRAMLPLIVFSLLFGFGVNLNGGAESLVGKFLEDLSGAMMQVVKIVTYYAPIAFFGFFADLVATYGPQIAGNYVRALAVYYPLCLIYVFTAFPLFAWFGGGKEGVKVMFQHILRPAITSLGTCSSVATIPTNIEAAEDSGIPKDVSDMVLPLGATMHMDGSCFSCVLKIAFLFGVFGVPFTGFDTYVKIILVAVLSSVGMSGIPGGGYIGEFIMCSIFFPDQLAVAYPIAITIGNLVDPPATMINSAGDYVVSFMVARFVDGKDWLKNATARKQKELSDSAK
ncbi:MAG: dicarboxylate/amino acid:cation symporter [Oscillospiraceae bacterium]